MSYVFSPPTYVERPITGERLTETRLKVTRGTTVLKSFAGAYTQTNYPTQDDIAGAAVAYLGGHDYVVSDTEAAALQAAGYTVTPYVPPVGSASGSTNPANVNGPQGPGTLTRTYP